ncbi:MAG: NgoPII family restriction endonuclease [Rhizonema sp. PD38]|nr:NgoPII family restriction endonuclease [Rhizonema sp. PD38]
MTYQAATNILKAIKSIIDCKMPDVIEYYRSSNRINSIGDSLELFIKDTFADSINISDVKDKYIAHEKVFSWVGKANNPPDFMIKGGDAVEVKKITKPKARIALGSISLLQKYV